MALRYAVANGNWSSTATWNGGTLPTSADDVYANNFTVTVDQNITVLSLRTTSSTPAINGGVFIILNGITITATVQIFPGTTDCIQYNGTTSATVIGDTYGSQIADFRSGLVHNGTGTLNQIGNAYGSGNTPSGVSFGRAQTPGSKNISAGILNITGNIYGGSGSTSPGARNESSGILNITGNLYSLIGSPAVIQSIGTGTINIQGLVFGGINSAVLIQAVSICNIIGPIYSSNASSGVIVSNTSAQLTVSTPCINVNNKIACYSPNIRIFNSFNSSWEFQNELSSNVTLYEPGTALGNPAVTDVRDGVIYASGALTGTLEVPPASSVAVGVPVDNTTGTAIISVTDMGALLASYNV
jgi:hypothetical protein